MFTKVPMVRGRIGTFNKREGWLYDEEAPGYIALRSALKAAAEQVGSNFTPTALMGQVRDIFSNMHAAWEKDKGDTAGYVFETHINGQRFLIAETRVLQRVSLTEAERISASIAA